MHIFLFNHLCLFYAVLEMHKNATKQIIKLFSFK